MASGSAVNGRRSAVSRPTRIGVVVNNVGGYSRGVVAGITRYARSRAWTCLVQGVNVDVIHPRTGDFDGLIVQTATPQQAKTLAGSGLPVVNVSSKLELQGFPSVVSDDRAVGLLGAQYFLERNHRHFLFFAIEDKQFAKLRHDGFAHAIRRAKLPCHFIVGESNLSAALSSISKPVAVMCANDRAGLAVLEACRALSMRVPDDVAVLGVDNDDLVQSLCWPPLSTINTARQRIGFEAGAMLDRLLLGKKLSTRTLLIPPQSIFSRQSTDDTAIADEPVRDALRYIHAHAGKPISVNDVLRDVALSRRQLERRFRTARGRTIQEEIERCRVERARSLLIEGELTLQQVALASGFASANYFSVVFKRVTGRSPTQFREQSTAI
jgi:LacI family transcriptional regulator